MIVMAKKLLIVDDKLELRQLLRSYLVEEGFEVYTASNGQEALFTARDHKPDLIILDLMMPEMSGFEFLRTFRRESDTPVIVLTARLEENDKVVGLELGADDYVTKPFSMRELTARVRAVLRRMDKAVAAPERLRRGQIELDRTSRLVWVNGSGIDPFGV